MQQQLFVSPRDTRVISLTGHAIAFKKGVPTAVPKIMHREVMEKGIMPCDDGGKALSTEAAVAATEDKTVKVGMPEDPAEREELVLKAMRLIVERNNPADFTGGGTPGAAAMTMALGWKIDAKDVRRVWEKHRAAILAEARK